MREPVSGAHEPHFQAMDVIAKPAELAGTARLAWVDGDKVSNRDGSNARPHLNNLSGRFVSNRDGFTNPDRAEAAIVIVVQVRPANSPCAD